MYTVTFKMVSLLHSIGNSAPCYMAALIGGEFGGAIDGKTMETVTDFIFMGSKITADGDCSHEIKRCLLLGRKAMINLGNILKKQRHHFADKGPYSQSYVFSSSHVQM